ncbi:MAG: hypothetical protein OEM51_09180 [Gammaproteobacteria bacterium]|nr:hypothetical protein [Gammaproteobacteria bacterium]MDH3431423.1 hypothetical protein [Gammaproteobacteria bacterium]
MHVRNFFSGVIAITLLLGSGAARAAECKYSDRSTDPATGVQKLATRPVEISTAMVSSSGWVHAVSIGDDRFLAIKLRAKNQFPIPPQLNINLANSDQEQRTGRYDPRLNQELRRLQHETAFVPAGSTLRITLEDRSVIVLTSKEDSSARNKGWKPQSGSENTGPNFLLLSEVNALYPLSAEMIRALTSRLAVSVRMETADRYYEFASRMNIQYPLTIGDKNGRQLQEAVNCVL